MGLTGSICSVVDGLPILRPARPEARVRVGPCREPCAAMSPTEYSRTSWEAQQGHTDLSAQLFRVTLAASCASKPSLNERVEVSGSHGHLSLANHPWSLPSSGSRSLGLVCFVAAGSLACGLQS